MHQRIRREDFPGGPCDKETTCRRILAGDARDSVLSLGREDPLEEGMATHSSILDWKIPWTEKTGRLLSMGVTKSWTRLSEQEETLSSSLSPCLISVSSPVKSE